MSDPVASNSLQSSPVKLLEIQNLSLSFQTLRDEVDVIRNLSISVPKGEIFAIIGESGCGKSVTAKAINRILPKDVTKIKGGRILFEGNNLLLYSEEQMRKVRGSKISMIFQEPMTSLNPSFTIGQQLMDVFIANQKLRRAEAHTKAIAVLQKVHMPSPELRIHNYPHELSGGMQQRVMIAMALAAPAASLLIADEPTTALDVTIQAQILSLLCELRDQLDLTILLITHDIGLVAQYADRMVVMYCGKKVEEGSVEEVFSRPSHPYTQGLLRSLPGKQNQSKRLQSIPGSVPDLRTLHSACPFSSRCEYATAVCLQEFPELSQIENGGLDSSHIAFCHHLGDLKGRSDD